ncbi:MAG: glycosyltransferase family 39 protein [Chloroflexota bacterium]
MGLPPPFAGLASRAPGRPAGPLWDRRDALIALVVFLAGLAVNLHAIPTTEFHRDEARWIHRARFITELRHPTSAYWSDRELMWGQPPLGSYLMGLGLVLQGRDTATNAFYDFHFDEAWNRLHGAIPDEQDLLAARRTNAAVGGLIAACIYLIGAGILGRAAGLLGALMYVPHALAIYLGSLAGSDALLGLLVALAALAAMALAARPSWPRATVLGVIAGLGASAKLSPIFVTVPLALLGGALVAGALLTHRQDGPARASLGWKLMATPPIAFAAFVASYPYLWPDPVGRTISLLQFRQREMYNQGRIWPELDVTGPLHAVERIAWWLSVDNSVTGNAVEGLAGLAGVQVQVVGIDLLLAVAGAAALAVIAWRRGLASPAALAALVLGAQVAIVVAGMRADFARYLMPVLVAQAVCVGVLGGVALAGLGRLAARAREAAARRRLAGPAGAAP